MTSKTRAKLRSLATAEQPIFQVGKDGVTEGVLRQLEELLESHELVKGKVLESAMASPRSVAEALCGETHAEAVQCIGTKFVLYRQAREPDKRKIALVK